MDEAIKHILAIRENVEIDQALRLISKKLDMSLQTLYAEYNRVVGYRQDKQTIKKLLQQ